MKTEIRELNELDEEVFLKSFELWKDIDTTWYSFIWKPGMDFKEHLNTLNNEKDPTKVAAGRVPATMLYAFIEDQVVARVSIRHTLNDYLLARGGHIGYAVAPPFRNKGIATLVYKEGLNYCKEQLGLEKVLVTCSDINIGSIKVIEKFSHKLENKIIDESTGELTRRYWVTL